MRKNLIIFSIFGALAAEMIGVAVALESNAGCDQAQSILPDLACVETPNGVAMAADAARAKRLIDLAEGGASRFRTHFGQEPLRYAVAEGPNAVIAAEKINALRAAGFKVVLPWLSDAVFSEQAEKSIRFAMEAQMAGQPAEAIEAAVEAGLKQQLDPARRTKIELAAVPHELGHDWFRIGYWPDAPLGENKHYGGPSPDWLDELSAVLMEAPEMFDERIAQFAQRYATYRQNPEKADENVRLMVDLKNYFSEEHPVAAQVRLLDRKKTEDEKSAVSLIVGDEGRKMAETGFRFYLQSAVVSQYLIDRTNDPKVFSRIAEAFVRGETIEQWLANDEPKGALPHNLQAVQADWLAWLETRFPAD